MTLERLEELIKQNSLVYFGTYNENNVFILREIKLSNCFILGNELFDEQEGYYYDFVDLFETKEQVEWHCKMDTERTERFVPPMWDEIETFYCFRFIKDYFVCELNVNKEIGKLRLVGNDFGELIEATKENYEKACEKVRDLFKEEK